MNSSFIVRLLVCSNYHVPINLQRVMWAARAFTAHTCTYSFQTLVLSHHSLMLSEDFGWIVWSCSVTELDAVLFFCFCLVFAHTHSLIHCSFYPLMLLLAFSIWLEGYTTQMEFVSSESQQILIQSKLTFGYGAQQKNHWPTTTPKKYIH